MAIDGCLDTKKKELVGNFRNNGREWRPKGRPGRACTGTLHRMTDTTGPNDVIERLWLFGVLQARRFEVHYALAFSADHL